MKFRPLILSILLAFSLLAASAPVEVLAESPPTRLADNGAGTKNAKAKTEKKAPRRTGRPLPGVNGTTLDGASFSLTNYLGKRTVIFFFDPSFSDSDIAVKAIQGIESLQQRHNFSIVGIGMGSPNATGAFAAKHGLEFPIVIDSTRSIARRYGLRDPLALIGMNSEGYYLFGIGRVMQGIDDPAVRLEAQLREELRLPSNEESSSVPTLGEYPMAPDFTTTRLDSATSFTLSELRGKTVILILFLHTCPHCHHALNFLKKELPKIPEDKRPVLIGVEVSGKRGAASERLKEEGLDFFPALLDRDRSIATSFGSFGSVPDIFLIDAEGHIVDRFSGWRDDREAPLFKMRITKLAGVRIPMLLNKNGYSGNEFCVVCHEVEAQTWAFTQHASAFSTLVKHGDDRDPECVSCHVVGDEEPGGFSLSSFTPHMEGVGCESCHGPGGPHVSKEFEEIENYEPFCKNCHNPKHSLGFDYETFLPKVSHEANEKLLSLPFEERQKLLAERGQTGARLLPSKADFVGSEACRSCHEDEFKTWAAGPHATAVKTLAKKDPKSLSDPACLECHTTGYGKKGGFAKTDSVTSNTAMAHVGCESCHGPGSDHIPEDPEAKPEMGTILSLGDKCDSCVILQICGTCHDDANDPEFEFKVQEKIDKIRHGTIEPAATRAGSAAVDFSLEQGNSIATVGLLDRAFTSRQETPHQ